MSARALAYLVAALAIALAISTAGNAWLARLYLASRDQRQAAIASRDQAQAMASSCSKNVAELEKQAKTRADEAKRAQAQAAAAARSHQAGAQQILASPPAVPGDACASAGAAIDAWLQGRARK